MDLQTVEIFRIAAFIQGCATSTMIDTKLIKDIRNHFAAMNDRISEAYKVITDLSNTLEAQEREIELLRNELAKT